MCTVLLNVSGKVQHVQFREDVFKLAIKYHLNGSDENLTDGTVKVIFQGQPSIVNKAINLIKQNQFNAPYADVKKIKVKRLSSKRLLDDFKMINWTSSYYCSVRPRTIVWHDLKQKKNDYTDQEVQKIVRQLLLPFATCHKNKL